MANAYVQSREITGYNHTISIHYCSIYGYNKKIFINAFDREIEMVRVSVTCTSNQFCDTIILSIVSIWDAKEVQVNGVNVP